MVCSNVVKIWRAPYPRCEMNVWSLMTRTIDWIHVKNGRGEIGTMLPVTSMYSDNPGTVDEMIDEIGKVWETRYANGRMKKVWKNPYSGLVSIFLALFIYYESHLSFWSILSLSIVSIVIVFVFLVHVIFNHCKYRHYWGNLYNYECTAHL